MLFKAILGVALKTINTLPLPLKTSRWNTDAIAGLFMGSRIMKNGNGPTKVGSELIKMICPSEWRLVSVTPSGKKRF